MNSDGVNDLLLRYESFNSTTNKAVIYIKRISEPASPESSQTGTGSVVEESEKETNGERTLNIIKTIIIIALLVILVSLIIIVRRRKGMY